jgi:hypothetical protein
MYHEIAGTLVLIAAVPRKECVKLPASRAACCFKKRPAKPRMSKTVNKGIRGTTSGRSSFSSTPASRRCACNKMKLDGGILMLRGLSVANSCQSLNVLF